MSPPPPHPEQEPTESTPSPLSQHPSPCTALGVGRGGEWKEPLPGNPDTWDRALSPGSPTIKTLSKPSSPGSEVACRFHCPGEAKVRSLVWANGSEATGMSWAPTPTTDSHNLICGHPDPTSGVRKTPATHPESANWGGGVDTLRDVWEGFSQVHLCLNHSLTTLGPGTIGTTHPTPPTPLHTDTLSVM